MIAMHRILAVLKLNSKNYTTKAAPTILKLNKFPEAQIDDAVKKMPELQKFTKDQWQKAFDTFVSQGLHANHFMTIIGKRPQLLRRPADKLVQSFVCLRETQFGDESIIQLIEAHPEMLEYDNSFELRKRMAFLKIYAKTEKNIFRLFLSSPNIITDSEAVIQKKIEYLTRIMKVDETDAAKSMVFSHSLDVIKCRHVFLSRLGLFKPKNPKVDPLQPSSNPKMDYIYSTSNREFAVKTCRVTLEEFETFRELYKREQNSQEDYEDVDEDD